MSRIYARSNELFDTCKTINAIHIKRHKPNRTMVDWNDLENCPNLIECYLSKDAVDLLSNHKIEILKDPFSLHARRSNIVENESTRVSFPTLFFAREEFKRELVFLLGLILGLQNIDKEREDFSYDIQDEYRDVLPLLLEYLYMKDSSQEDKYSLKKLWEIKTWVKDYIKNVAEYRKRVEAGETLLRTGVYLSSDGFEGTLAYRDENIENIENLTQHVITPFSSMDATLKIIDMNLSQDEVKALLDKLYKNECGDRARVMESYGIKQDGYKRLIKEFEQHKR